MCVLYSHWCIICIWHKKFISFVHCSFFIVHCSWSSYLCNMETGLCWMDNFFIQNEGVIRCISLSVTT
jgi:hypothetical protein